MIHLGGELFDSAILQLHDYEYTLPIELCTQVITSSTPERFDSLGEPTQPTTFMYYTQFDVISRAGSLVS